MNSPTHPTWVRAAPNALTFLRLGLAVALPLLPAAWRLPAILVAAFTDFLDGYIARRFHATTDLGRLLDGIADKAFAAATVLTLVLDGSAPVWQGALVLSRDLVVTALALRLATTHRWEAFRHMKVRWAGKLATLFAFAWFATLLLPTPNVLRTIAFCLAAAVSLWASVDYLAQADRLRRARAGKSR